MSDLIDSSSSTFSYDGSKLQTFTVPEAGIYEITASARAAAPATGREAASAPR
jgi:hypothetical protein